MRLKLEQRREKSPRQYQELRLTHDEWRQLKTIAAAREMTQVDLATSIMRAAIQAEFESGET